MSNKPYLDYEAFSPVRTEKNRQCELPYVFTNDFPIKIVGESYGIMNMGRLQCSAGGIPLYNCRDCLFQTLNLNLLTGERKRFYNRLRVTGQSLSASGELDLWRKAVVPVVPVVSKSPYKHKAPSQEGPCVY